MLLRSNRILLDASAVLAMLLEERGSSVVEGVLDNAAISAVNFGEVVSALAKRCTSEQEINDMLFGLFPKIYTADQMWKELSLDGLELVFIR